jgi:hypothetical protein
MVVSLFGVPVRELPPLSAVLRTTVRPVLVSGRALVGAAWVRYEPGGTLHYRELLSAVLVHERGRPRVSITDIWVDSVASRDGGRELWGIPKELAGFTLQPGRYGAVRAGSTIATAQIRSGRALPGRWPVAFSVAQALGDRVRRTPVRGRAGLRAARVRWRTDPDGPLGYLAGRTPVFSVAVTDFRLSFGAPDAVLTSR